MLKLDLEKENKYQKRNKFINIYKMKWDDMPQDITRLIFYYRKILTCSEYFVNKIISVWKCYKIRVLIGRFKMLRYLKDFKYFNPSIKTFLLRSKL